MTEQETARDHRLRELAIANVVDQIDGVSDRVIDGLDEEFGTATAVAEASINDLQRVDGIGLQIAMEIFRQTRWAVENPELHLGDERGRHLRGTRP